MASYTVTKSPGTVEDLRGPWIGKDNVKVKDGMYAVAHSPSMYDHKSLNVYNFGFNIPSTATITRINYSVTWKVNTPASNSYLYGNIYMKNVIIGSEMWDPTEPLVDTTVTRTNGSNGLTPAIVNSSDKNIFRIFIQVQHGSNAAGFTAYIDYISASITYDDSGTTPVPTPLKLTASQVDDYIKLTWS